MKARLRVTGFLIAACISAGLELLGCTTIREPYNVVPITVSPPAPTSKLSFAYVGNVFGNSVSMYTVSPSGMWTPTVPATISATSLAESLVVDPSGRFVYLPNTRANTVSMFTINLTNGLLVPMSPATVPTGAFPQYIAEDPKGRFVYTANTNDNTVSMFASGSNGVLVPTSPASVHAGHVAGLGPGGIVVDPTGRFVYTSNYAGSLSEFSIDQVTGVLTPIGPGEVIGFGFPFTPAVDPGGRFLYVPDNDNSRVYSFIIDQTTGALSPTPQLPVGVDQGPTSVGIDPQSRFAYVVSRDAGTISQFTINAADGSLSPMAVPTISNPGLPWQILIDPSGQLAYVSNEDLNTVNIYSIGTDGALSPYSLARTGQTPGGIGIAVKR